MSEVCKWVVTMDGNTKEFNSDFELDAFVLDAIQNKKIGIDPTSGTFQSLDPQEASKQIIDDIIKEAGEGAVRRVKQVGDDPDDFEIYYQIPGSIGVTRFLQEFGLPGATSTIVTKFDEAHWKDNKIEEYVNSGISVEDAEALVNKEMQSWPKMSEMGTEVHALFEWVFNGEKDELPKPKYLSEDLVDSTLNQIRNFKKSIEAQYKNCIFYTELPIKSSDLEPTMKALLENAGYSSINGKIDLLVVDEFGKGHIYDFKVSRKKVDASIWDELSRIPNAVQRQMEKDRDEKYGLDISEHWWHSTKKEAASHQLALYSAMLRQKGISVVDANIVPVHTTLTYDDPDTQLSVSGITGVDVQFGKDERGRSKMITRIAEVLDGGKYNRTANQVIHNGFKLTGDLALSLQNAYNVFFPKNATIADKEHNKANIEHYKEDPNTVQLLKPSDAKYGEKKYKVVKRYLNGQVEYAKDDDELNAILEKYVKQIADNKAQNNLSLANDINAVMQGTANVEDFANNQKINVRSFIKSQFDRYFINGWTFEREDTLNSLGIFIFTKGDKVEIVSLTDQSLKTKINLGPSKHDTRYNILGKTKKDRVINNKEILSSTGGHMELMKTMAYIAMNADKFKNKKIAEVRVVNAMHGSEDTVENSKLINNYNQLCQENPEANAPKVNSDLFMNDVSAYIEGAKERMEANGQDFDGFFDANKTEYTAEWIHSAIEKMKADSTYGELLYDDSNYDPNNPIWHAYVYLNKAYLASQGYFSVSEKDIEDFSTGGIKLDGLKISSMQYSPSANIRTLGEIINKFANAVRRKAYNDGIPMIKCFQEIYEKYGTGSKVFKSWFETDANGNIRSDLKLRDPEDPIFNGDPIMKKGLDTFLKTMAKLRWGDDISEADIQHYKTTKEYYELPLTEAVASRQLKNLGVGTAIKNKIQQYSELTQGIFAGSDIDVEEEAKTSGKLYNKFALSGPARQHLIDEKSTGFFETDIELIFNEALIAYTKSNMSKEYLPMISALRLSLAHIDSYGGSKKGGDKAKVSNIVSKFDDLVKSKVYGESIMSENAQRVMKVLNVVKAGFTTMTLSLNVRSFLRESLQGIWTGLSRAGVASLGSTLLPGISEKTYVAGLTHVIQESHKNISGVSKLQQLNQIYAMANQSLSQVARNRRLNWLNVNHWGKDTLFLTATAPDFMHRVSILVAKMMGDNCWDAHSLDENGVLVYDWKKDNRFEAYIKNDTSNPDYLKQRSLYLTMLEDFNKEGVRNSDGSLLKEGDALPQAYTSKEAQSIKNYADILYGHYDDESRSLICDSLFGAFFLQYKTFLTAKVEQWFMTGGVYNTETIQQQKDPFGNNLYELIRYDDYDKDGKPIGMPHRDILSESEYNELSEEDKRNAKLYFDYSGIPMEGMIQEQLSFGKYLMSLDEEGLKDLWNDPIRRGYFLLGMHDWWIMMLMSFLTTFVLGNIFNIEKKDGELYTKTVVKQVRDIDPGSQLLYNVLVGSMADSQLPNLVSSFTDKPPVIGAVSKFATSSFKLMTGDSNLGYYLTQNLGIARDFQGIAKRALEE